MALKTWFRGRAGLYRGGGGGGGVRRRGGIGPSPPLNETLDILTNRYTSVICLTTFPTYLYKCIY